MMQSYASAAKLRGSGPNLHSGFESHGFDVGSPLPRICRRRGLASASQVAYRLSRAVDYCAGRKARPAGPRRSSTRRQSAISSLRAKATIIVLRVLPTPISAFVLQTIGPERCLLELMKRQANWIIPHRTRALPARAKALLAPAIAALVGRAGEAGEAGHRPAIAQVADKHLADQHVRGLTPTPTTRAMSRTIAFEPFSVAGAAASLRERSCSTAGFARAPRAAAQDGGATPRACSPARAPSAVRTAFELFLVPALVRPEAANAKAREDGLHSVHHPGLLGDRLSRSRFGRRASSSSIVGIAAMLQWPLLPAQPTQKGPHQQFRVEAIGLRAPVFARTAMLVGWMT